jgi:hypothetical protein
MNSVRINNYRMAAYAAIATGLINLRYQTGAADNLAKSAALFLPGALLFALTLTAFGKKILEGRTAAIVVTICGAALLGYSFIL